MNTSISSKRSSQILSLAREKATCFSDESWWRMVEPLGWSWWSWSGWSWTHRRAWNSRWLAMGPGQPGHRQDRGVHVVPETPRSIHSDWCASHGSQRHNHGASQRVLYQQAAGWIHSCYVRDRLTLAHWLLACGPAQVGLVPCCLVYGGIGGVVWCDYDVWWMNKLQLFRWRVE